MLHTYMYIHILHLAIAIYGTKLAVVMITDAYI